MAEMEKRIRRRHPVSLFVNQEYDDRRQTLSMSLDLSGEGITLISLLRDDAAPDSRHAWVRFRLPGEPRPINALGEVVHRHADQGLSLQRTGIRFKFLFPDQRRMLERYLADIASGAV